MLSNLDKLKQKILNKKPKGNIVNSLFTLIKELHCLPEVIGREYEVEYDDKGRVSKIHQLPMKISSLMVLLHELKADHNRQEREAEKIKNRRK